MVERIAEIRARLSRAIAGEISSVAFRSYAEADIPYLLDQIDAKDAEIERLRKGLECAIRAAGLAIFVIRKAGVMPNSSWEGGFAQDMKIAKECLEEANADE